MPGPGKQTSGPGSQTAGALQEQVLVAAFPDTPPEVHLACLDPDKGVLGFREASVRPGGDVSLGVTRIVQLSEAASVEIIDQVGTVLGHDGRLLVQMHFERTEEQDAWAEGIRRVIKARARENDDNDDDNVQLLQARSQQLQNQIGDLEAVSEHRDKQLQKLFRRLDGAMQMLAAVKDMCEQQRKVIDAQKVAITELRKECGNLDTCETVGEKNGKDTNLSQQLIKEMIHGENSGVKQEPTKSNSSSIVEETENCSGDDQRDVAEAEAEIAAKTQQMLALLQQADKMQRALQQLEAIGPPGNSNLGTSPAGTLAQMTASTVPTKVSHSPEQFPEAAEDVESVEDDVAVLNRLNALKAEKQKYEGMLRQSQQEHENLIKKMNDMRSLMEVLGVNDDAFSNSDEEDDAAVAVT